jgi:hypothetical protein
MTRGIIGSRKWFFVEPDPLGAPSSSFGAIVGQFTLLQMTSAVGGGN